MESAKQGCGRGNEAVPARQPPDRQLTSSATFDCNVPSKKGVRPAYNRTTKPVETTGRRDPLAKTIAIAVLRALRSMIVICAVALVVSAVSGGSFQWTRLKWIAVENRG